MAPWLCCDSLGVEAMDVEAMVQIGELSANGSGVWKKTARTDNLKLGGFY